MASSPTTRTARPWRSARRRNRSSMASKMVDPTRGRNHAISTAAVSATVSTCTTRSVVMPGMTNSTIVLSQFMTGPRVSAKPIVPKPSLAYLGASRIPVEFVWIRALTLCSKLRPMSAMSVSRSLAHSGGAARLGSTFLVMTVLLLPRYLVGVVAHDEGFIASGAMLVANGKLPYRDFLNFYGPAEYYVLAALFAVFGQDLLVLRIVHVCTLAALGIVLILLCRK